MIIVVGPPLKGFTRYGGIVELKVADDLCCV